jgi:hypothetical protein
MLFKDFSAHGRVLATKVFVPAKYYQGKSVNHLGAFVEFATREAALHVMNTVREYRGVQTDIKWARKSLVESIKEQQQRLQETMEGRGSTDEAKDSTAENAASDNYVPPYGTVYTEVCTVDTFIQEQAWLWQQQIQSHYAAMGAPPAPPARPLPTPAPMLHASRASHPGSIPPSGVPMFLRHHPQSVHHHPAGMPIMPIMPILHQMTGYAVPVNEHVNEYNTGVPAYY